MQLYNNFHKPNKEGFAFKLRSLNNKNTVLLLVVVNYNQKLILF